MELYVKAVESLKESYTSRSYIYWKQFLIFVIERLPIHKQYRLNEEEIRVGKEWCSRAIAYAMSVLESIVAELDHQEDMVRAAAASAQDIDLIDEFDNPVDDLPNASKQTDPSPVITATSSNVNASALLEALSVLKPDASVDTHTGPTPPLAYPSLSQELQGPPSTCEGEEDR